MKNEKLEKEVMAMFEKLTPLNKGIVTYDNRNWNSCYYREKRR
jgi:hypothetical protein